MLQVFIGQLRRWNKILCEEENFMKWKNVSNEIHESFGIVFFVEIVNAMKMKSFPKKFWIEKLKKENLNQVSWGDFHNFLRNFILKNQHQHLIPKIFLESNRFLLWWWGAAVSFVDIVFVWDGSNEIHKRLGKLLLYKQLLQHLIKEKKTFYLMFTNIRKINFSFFSPSIFASHENDEKRPFLSFFWFCFSSLRLKDLLSIFHTNFSYSEANLHRFWKLNVFVI